LAPALTVSRWWRLLSASSDWTVAALSVSRHVLATLVPPTHGRNLGLRVAVFCGLDRAVVHRRQASHGLESKKSLIRLAVASRVQLGPGEIWPARSRLAHMADDRNQRLRGRPTVPAPNTRWQRERRQRNQANGTLHDNEQAKRRAATGEDGAQCTGPLAIEKRPCLLSNSAAKQAPYHSRESIFFLQQYFVFARTQIV
jgi:hypothetical protein